MHDDDSGGVVCMMTVVYVIYVFPIIIILNIVVVCTQRPPHIPTTPPHPTPYTHTQRLVAAALMLSLLTAFTISHTRSPYSSTYPKRVWIQHMSDVEYSTGNVSHTYVLGSWDNIPSSVVVPEGCVGECVLLEPTGREWLVCVCEGEV